MPSDFNSNKIQDGGGRYFEFPQNPVTQPQVEVNNTHHSIAVAHILRKFCKETEHGVPEAAALTGFC